MPCAEPAITFIVPAYNARDYLPVCLEHLLAQRTVPFEVVVVDDGSTDGTGDVLDRWAARDDRIVAVHTANRGQGPARNEGIRRARGTYLFFTDADDYVLWDGIEELLRQAQGSDCQIISGSYMRLVDGVLKEEGTGVPEGVFDRAGSAREQALFHLIKTQNMFGYCTNKLYRRDFVAATGVEFGDHRMMQDQLFNCMLYADNPRASYARVPLFVYVIHGDSVSKRSDPLVAQKLSALLAAYDDFLRRRDAFDENQDLFVPLAMRLYAWSGFRALEQPGATRGDVVEKLRLFLEKPCMDELLRDRRRRRHLNTVRSLPQRAAFKLLYDTARWGGGSFHAALFCRCAPLMRAYIKAVVK